MIDVRLNIPLVADAPSRSASACIVSEAPAEKAARLHYLDHLKAALIVCVVVFHVAITYGANGSWYYVEDRGGITTEALLTVLVAALQFFFMGLFFAISGYFTPMTYNRKGTERFMKDRLKRLGIPLVIFALVISPVLEGVKTATHDGDWGEFWPSWRHHLITWTPGPMWFVETLLIFSAGYAVWRRAAASRTEPPAGFAFSPRRLLTFMTGLVVVSFVVRLRYPVGAEFQHLQLAFYPQYIAMFVIGTIAYERKWLGQINAATGRRWLITGAIAIIAIPFVLILGGAAKAGGNLDAFFGGLHWQAAAMAVLEALILVGMSIGLIARFSARFTASTSTWRFLSDNAYAVYVIHAPIVVALTFACRDIAAPSLLKFVVLAPIAVAASFIVSDRVVRKIPRAVEVL